MAMTKQPCRTEMGSETGLMLFMDDSQLAPPSRTV